MANAYFTDPANSAVRMLSPVLAGIIVNSVTNAASNLPGPVAPGELVVLYGSGLGGVRSVLFNGVPGPLLYDTPTQVGAVVPYAVAGNSVQVAVQGASAASAPVAVAVVPTAPGIFTADGSGRGQAVALNQDGTPNSSSAPAIGGLRDCVLCHRKGTNAAGRDRRQAGGAALPRTRGTGQSDRRRSERGDPLRSGSSRSDRGGYAGERRGPQVESPAMSP